MSLLSLPLGLWTRGICFALASTSIFLQNSAVPPLVLVSLEEGRITKSCSQFLLGDQRFRLFLDSAILSFSWAGSSDLIIPLGLQTQGIDFLRVTVSSVTPPATHICFSSDGVHHFHHLYLLLESQKGFFLRQKTVLQEISRCK